MTDPANFLEANIIAYITAFGNIQDRKDIGEDLVVKIPPPHVNNKTFPQFANILWNWMSTQYIIYQITPLVYMVS